MDTLLVLVGLSIFLAGMALYLNMTLKQGANWLLASIAFPPTIVLFHSRFWQKTKFSAYVQIAGLTLLVFGFLAGVQRHPEKYEFSVLRPVVGWLSAKQTLASENSTAQVGEVIASIREHNGKLAGHVGANDFVLDHAEYTNGVLKFSDTLHQQEVSLFIGVDASQLPDQWSRYVAPEQVGITVQLTMTNSHIQSFNSGYKLNLRLHKVAENKVAGNIELLLADQRRSFLVGTFEAATSQVRFRGGEIDRTLENEDTVFYVISDYLHKNYPEQISKVVSVSGLQRHFENGVQHASAAAVVKMVDGEEHAFDIYTVKRDSGWEVSENNSTQLLAAVRAMQRTAPAAGKPQFNVTARPIELDARNFLARAAEFIGRWMEIEVVGGLTQRGVLSSVDSNTIALRPIAAGADKAVLNIRRDNIVRVKVPVEK